MPSAAGGEQHADDHADAGSDANGQQGTLTHRLLDAGPQAGIEIVEELLELILQGTDPIGQLAGLGRGHLQELVELMLHTAGGAAGLIGNQRDNVVEAAAGGLEGFACHLGPLALDRGNQGFEPLPKAVVVDGCRFRFHGVVDELLSVSRLGRGLSNCTVRLN